MSWITVVWSSIASGCLTLGLVHLVIWFTQPRLRVHLAFFFLTLSVAAVAIGELQLMRAQTPEQYGTIMRWVHVPVFFMVVSIVVFVRLYFKAGRLWLAYAVCALRLLSLVLNFYLDPNLNYRAITDLQEQRLFGETVAVAIGIGSPWRMVGEASSLLLVSFLLDATLAYWRRGGPLERRRALVVGGSFLLLVGVAAGSSWLIHIGVIGSVYLISLPFVVVLAAMGFELSADASRSARLADQLRASEFDRSRSEQRMDQAAEAARIGVWEWDMQRDDVWVTDRGRSLFGFALNERIDFNRFLQTLHSDDRLSVQEAVMRSRDQAGTFDREYRITTAEQGVRWIHTRGKVEADASGSAAIMRGISFDITERKLAEQLFQDVVEAAPCGIVILDRDGRILLVNAQMESEFGYSSSEMRGQSIEILLPDRFRKSHRDHVDHFFAQQTARTMAGRAVLGRRRDGSEVPLEVGLSRIETAHGPTVLATIVDVSERVQRAEALQAERAFLRQVIDMNPNLIFAKDTEGRFTLVNQAVADIYGTSVEALIGQKHQSLDYSAEESEFFRRMDLAVIETGQERFIAEERITDASGKAHWLQTIKRPIVNKDGTVNQVLGVSTDITARKQTDIELAQQRNELAHLSRVMMLGELSGSLAHELNQPLTAILSNAQAAQRFMARAYPDLGELRDILQDIVDDDKRAGEVIHGLRLLLKKGEMRHETLDANEAVRSVLRLVRSDMLNSGVGVVTHLASDLPKVKGDRVQLQQVLLNLVVNGCDAMAEVAASDRVLTVSTQLVNGQGIQVCVTDHGRGIAPDDLERVFESFYTTKPHGLGLGLAVCRKIVSAHGGRLWAESGTRNGSTFSFTLPPQSD
jgi:PAS domain S-box-containing protein